MYSSSSDFQSDSDPAPHNPDPASNNPDSHSDSDSSDSSDTSSVASDRSSKPSAAILGKNGKLTSRERQRRFDYNLCLYCGGSGHMLINCQRRLRAAQFQIV